MKLVQTHRLVVTGIDDTLGGTNTELQVGDGVITGIFATVDNSVDSDASVGTTGAADIHFRVTDGEGTILLNYALGSSAAGLTIYADEMRGVGRGRGKLVCQFATDVDVGGSADAVGVVEITVES